jgi:hypothetical protein
VKFVPPSGGIFWPKQMWEHCGAAPTWSGRWLVELLLVTSAGIRES